MSIGYACQALGVPGAVMRSCLQKNANEDRLTALIGENLGTLERLIDYNIANGIKLFRISSDLIPFGSSPVNTLAWWELFRNEFETIGRKIKSSNMRVSLHPGQYTVLNSPDRNVVAGAVADLEYHAKILAALGTGPEHKLILHIGGVYGDKEAAAARFIDHYQRLPAAVKDRLVIENDDKSYTAADVLQIGAKAGIPVVFDNLHHAANPPVHRMSEADWIKTCGSTWHKRDGKQKIHYSQQHPGKRRGSHSGSIQIDGFMKFYANLECDDIDIMLEVKDKNQSALKCKNCIAANGTSEELEREWSRYQYSVLEKSPAVDREIRELLKDKSSYPAIPFYRLLEAAYQYPTEPENAVRSARYVWDNLKEESTPGEEKQFLNAINSYRNGKAHLTAVKNQLYRLAVKYERIPLLYSYYFLQ